MRVLGLDPGLQRTGWGVLEAEANRVRFIACGCVASDREAELASRLVALHDGLAAIIADHRPHEAAVEETVVNRNALSSLKLGHARGVVLLAAARGGLSVAEYAARTVKRAVTGTGGAAKGQVAMMVRTLLPGAGEVSGDAADALAVALCHAHHRATSARMAGALVGAGAP